jgi:hypothetical protein
VIFKTSTPSKQSPNRRKFAQSGQHGVCCPAIKESIYNTVQFPDFPSILVFSGKALCIVRIRVTRLGKFSPIVRLFSLGRFLKITEVENYRYTFFTRQVTFVFNLTKNGLGYIRTLWVFFHRLFWSP